MNSNIDRHVINDRSRDEPTSTKGRQSRALKIGGSRVARLFSRSSPSCPKEERMPQITAATTTTPINKGSAWVCNVCSFKNTNPADRCSRCQFYKEKPETSKPVLVVSEKKPGAYEVVENGPHQQLRPVQSTGKYTLKSDIIQKASSIENTATRPGMARPTLQRARAASTDSAASSVVANTSHSSLVASLAEEIRAETNKDEALHATERSVPPEEIFTSNDASSTVISNLRNSPARKTSVTNQLQPSYGRWTENEKGSWECSACTYINEDALHLTCAVCGSRRDSSSTCGNNGSDGDLDSIASNLSDDEDDASFDEEDREERKLEKMRMNELIMMQFELMAEYKGKSSERGSETVQHSSTKNMQRQDSLDQLSQRAPVHDDECDHRWHTADTHTGTVYDNSGLVLPESTETQSRIPSDGQQQPMLDQWQQEVELTERKIRELQRQQEELMRQIERERERRG